MAVLTGAMEYHLTSIRKISRRKTAMKEARLSTWSTQWFTSNQRKLTLLPNQHLLTKRARCQFFNSLCLAFMKFSVSKYQTFLVIFNLQPQKILSRRLYPVFLHKYNLQLLILMPISQRLSSWRFKSLLLRNKLPIWGIWSQGCNNMAKRKRSIKIWRKCLGKSKKNQGLFSVRKWKPIIELSKELAWSIKEL